MRIVVVGGVAAGMSAAARARRLDEHAEIVVLERGEHVSFANCGLPYYVGGEIRNASDLLVQTPQSLKAALDLDIRIRHEVTSIDTAAQTLIVHSAHGVQTLEYDALVLAPGAAAMRPALPGLDSPRVHTLRTVADALALRDTVTDGVHRIVVLGAGFIGLEAAEAFARRGVQVSVVELAEHVLPNVEREIAESVEEELRRLGVSVHTGVTAREIAAGPTDDTVLLADGTAIAADLILLSAGVRPDTEIAERAGIECERGAIVTDEHGRTSAPHVWAAGDAVLSTDAVTGLRRPVALAGPANRAGRQIADDILRPESARPLPPPVGTAIVRVGELTVATAGSNRAALTTAGIEFRTIHLHPNHHAGYFPGARQIHLLVHFRTRDGLLLGAQASGTDGVDKRIDVLATAIRGHMTVTDLIDLDLAYSPPYGQAKDPVNLAGMIGANVLDGTLALWYAQDLDSIMDSALVVDTRSRTEYRTGHLPGSLNIPHTELRRRLDEVRGAAAGRPVRVLCASGLRSAIAHRVLVQSGFDSASLSGGILTLRAWLGPRASEVLRTEAELQQAGVNGSSPYVCT